MISLISDMTDRKGPQARGWLFYDADCRFCTGIAACLLRPLAARNLAVAPLQDPRVGLLLSLPQEELLRAIHFVRADGARFAGEDAVLAVAQELWWARPLVWMAQLPGMRHLIKTGYRNVAKRRKCHAVPYASLPGRAS